MVSYKQSTPVPGLTTAEFPPQSEETNQPTRLASRVSFVRISERNVTKFAHHQAPKLIAWGKLTLDERVVLHPQPPALAHGRWQVLARMSPLDRGRDGEAKEAAQVLGIHDAEECGREAALVLWALLRLVDGREGVVLIEHALVLVPCPELLRQLIRVRCPQKENIH